MTRVKAFIENLPQKREQDLYKQYLDMYIGNVESLYSLKEGLEKIKHNIGQSSAIFFGGSTEPINEMKNTAIKEYLFYFNNTLFFNISSDAAIFFRPYIEAVICSNSELAKRDSGFEELHSNNKKYLADEVDYDIITKFIRTKDLSQIMREYNLKEFDVFEGIVAHLVSCYENLSRSIVTLHKNGYKNCFFVYLCNLALILARVPVSDDEAKRLAAATEQLMGSASFTEFFFSVHMPDFSVSLDAISTLNTRIPISPCFEIAKRIVSSTHFFDYANNVSFPKLRKIIDPFILKEDYAEQETDICSIIENETEIHKRICLLRLLFRHIHSEDKKRALSEYITDNFDRIGTQAIYDFVLSGWVSPSTESVVRLMNNTIESEKNQRNGIRVSPDPVRVNLECIYILYLNGTITDLSPLKVLQGEYPHLQFLLDPENFDYTKVDFSNYMWMNFARRERFMDYFVKHSKEIKPRLIESLKNGEAAEDERKVLYRFMTDNDELWSL